MNERLVKILGDNAHFIPYKMDRIRIPKPNLDIPLTFTDNPYPKITGQIDYEFYDVKPFSIKCDLSNYCHPEDDKINLYKDLALDRFVSYIKERFNKLEKSGVQVFLSDDSFNYNNRRSETLGNYSLNHYMSLDYGILEGEQFYKHCFVDSIYREGAVKEAIDHCKQITRRKINQIFRNYEKN